MNTCGLWGISNRPIIGGRSPNLSGNTLIIDYDCKFPAEGINVGPCKPALAVARH